MSVTRIASRYAKSLIDLSVEQGKLDRVLSDVELLLSGLDNRELYLLAKSPIIHASQKLNVFDGIFKGKMDEVTLSFIHLITKKGREAYLKDIARAFIDQYRELKNIIAVKLISAIPLTDDKVEAVKKKIPSTPGFDGSIEIETEVDPDIIGGLIIEIGDKQYDASVAHHLEKLKKTVTA